MFVTFFIKSELIVFVVTPICRNSLGFRMKHHRLHFSFYRMVRVLRKHTRNSLIIISYLNS